jgi:hypothetical protein
MNFFLENGGIEKLIRKYSSKFPNEWSYHLLNALTKIQTKVEEQRLTLNLQVTMMAITPEFLYRYIPPLIFPDSGS